MKLVLIVLGLFAVLLDGYPIYTGAIVPEIRPSLPPEHVRMPSYWSMMARYVDTLPNSGSLLVLPPDDFYQMPYRWGYYGSDAFIADLLHRHVLVPNGQGYSPASNQLLSAINLITSSILNHEWNSTGVLVKALNTPLILVRRDIVAPYPGRAILSPVDIDRGLRMAPNFTLLNTLGALDLFSLTSSAADLERVSTFATTESQLPDLRLLPLLGIDASLVTSQPRDDAPFVMQVPPLEQWTSQNDSLLWQAHVPVNRNYRVAELNSKSVLSIDRVGSYTMADSIAHVSLESSSADDVVSLTIPSHRAISNGDFSEGVWGPVRDCNAQNAAAAVPHMSATIIADAAPDGRPALRLSAKTDTACVSRALSYQPGTSLVLRMMARQAHGLRPRICLWEIGPYRCASLPALDASANWSAYAASVTPDYGTSAIDLYLYADGNGVGTETDYADVRVVEVSDLSSFALVGNPINPHATTGRLVVLHESYSADWVASNGRHVLVDGMLNGWLVESESAIVTVEYGKTRDLELARTISLVAWLLAAGVLGWSVARGGSAWRFLRRIVSRR